jgi:hypothetical protein
MKKVFAFFVFSVLAIVGKTQDFSSIKSDLEVLFHESIKLRSQVMPTIQSFGETSVEMDSLNRVIAQFDSSSLVIVEQVLQKYGWLGASEIGPMANQSIYLTIQHASQKEIREKYFPLLKVSAEKGESDLADMATMEDRILVENGQPQRYGTQYKMVDGQLEYLPIQDPKNVNKLRKAVGLSKISIKK